MAAMLDGQPTLSLQGLLEADKVAWQAIWSKFQESAMAPWRDSEAARIIQQESLPPLTVDGLRAAARSYRTRLGLGCDNVHLRWFDWLSDELLQAFVVFS